MHQALETSPAEMWVLLVAVSLLIFVTARYAPWGLLLSIPLASVVIWSKMVIVLHPGLAEDLIEMGALGFVVATWLSLGFALLSLVAGVLLRLRTRHAVGA
jgi:hypothetical protein